MCGITGWVDFGRDLRAERLAEYVWNVPWAMKQAGGIEKGLLRTAADGLLPGVLAIRPGNTAPAAFLLDMNRWLEQSGVTVA